MNYFLFGIIALAAVGIAAKSYMNAELLMKGYTYAWKVNKFKFVSFTKVSFDVLIEITNPSDVSLTIKDPFIKVFYKQTEFTANKYGTVPELTINKRAVTKLSPLTFTIDLLDKRIIDLARELYKYKSVDPLYQFFDVQVVGYVNGAPVILSQNMK